MKLILRPMRHPIVQHLLKRDEIAGSSTAPSIRGKGGTKMLKFRGGGGG